MAGSELCLNCFRIKGGFEVCPYCGWLEGALPEQAYHLHPGMTLNNRYILGTVLGFGGFGVTYKAWDSNLGQVVAIKEFYPSGLANRVPGDKQVVIYSGDKKDQYYGLLRRFLEEAQTMAKFSNHPNIVNVYNFFQENNTAYIVMECLEGRNLKEYLNGSGGKLSPDKALSIMKPLMDALAAIHSKGVIHRDIHPDNIFITNDGSVKILDLGAARLSRGEKELTLSVVITPGYASPEQYRSKSRQGPWTDIYGLGSAMYKMLTGVTPEESVDRQVKDTLKPPSAYVNNIDKRLDKAIMKALAIKPELRFQRMEDFKGAVFGGKEVDYPEVELKKRQRRRVLAAGLSLGVLVVLVVTGFMWKHIFPEKDSITNVSRDTITVWVPVNSEQGGEEGQYDEIAIMERIYEKFHSDYPQIEIEFTPVEAGLYSEKVAQAFKEGNTPALIASAYVAQEDRENLASLSLLYESLVLDNYLFLSGNNAGYGKYYPSMREIPAGFHVTVVYGNEAAKSAETELPDAITSPDQLFGSTFVVGENQYESFLSAFYGNGDKAGEAAAGVKEIYDSIKQDNDDTPWNIFSGDRSVYFIGDTSMYKQVQDKLPGYYKLIPFNSGSVYYGRFSNSWSVSGSHTYNQRKAAMLFLTYVLSEYGQTVMHVRYNTAIPLNKKAFSEYLNVYGAEMGFLSEASGNIALRGEDENIVQAFCSHIHNAITVGEMTWGEIQNFVNESYASLKEEIS